MSVLSSPATLPVQVENAVLQLEALAALLNCADPERWASLGRPSPRGLASLVYRATADLESGLDELEAPKSA